MITVKELYDIVKTDHRCASELEKVRKDNLKDLIRDVRHVVKLATNCTPMAVSDQTYEKVCQQIIYEF